REEVALRRLDLDDIGSHFAEEYAGPGADAVMRQVEHSKPGKRSTHCCAFCPGRERCSGRVQAAYLEGTRYASLNCGTITSPRSSRPARRAAAASVAAAGRPSTSSSARPAPESSSVHLPCGYSVLVGFIACGPRRVRLARVLAQDDADRLATQAETGHAQNVL